MTESESGLRLHRPKHLIVWQLRHLSSAPEAQFLHLCLKPSVPALQTCCEALRALNERCLEEGPHAEGSESASFIIILNRSPGGWPLALP